MPIPERLIPAALARVDAGEAIDAYERGRADERETRCPSCEHTWQFHQPDGCWFTVVTGRQDAVLNCACAIAADLIESETTHGSAG